MQSINMILGETRQVTAGITVAGSGSGFTINSPTWELSQAGVVVQSGIPSVSGNQLICTITPTASGVAILEYRFTIGPDVVIRRVAVNVST